MAISTNTFSLSASYTKQDMINQLEDAFTWLGWHDKCDHTGLVTGLVDYGIYQDTDGGETSYTRTFHDAEQYTSSGIGTGASFTMSRYFGNPNYVYVNRPGYGYTNGEYLEFLPGEASEQASGLGWGCTVFVDNSVSYGTTHNGFYAKNVHANNSYPYGILRHKIQDNKKYGVTYRAFQAPNTVQIEHQSGPFVHPKDPDPTGSGTYNGASGTPHYTPRMAGEYRLDMGWSLTDSYGSRYVNPKDSSFTGTDGAKTVASSNAYQLDLNLFRSGIDTNFCVMSYRQPTLSSTKLRDNTFYTFIPHNFTTPIWDLDYVFLGGMTEVRPLTNESQTVGFTLEAYCTGAASEPEYNIRMAEAPYDRGDKGVQAEYRSNLAYGVPDQQTYLDHLRIYNRDSTYDTNNNTFQINNAVSSNANYNAVIKGIPLNAMFVPSPYTMPEDFAFIDFIYDAPSVNIQQGDTITIDETEVYVVIHGCYNQTTKTRGILFVARKT